MKTYPSLKLVAAGLTGVVFLSGCTVGPMFQTPMTAVPTAYRYAASENESKGVIGSSSVTVGADLATTGKMAAAGAILPSTEMAGLTSATSTSRTHS